MSTAGLCAPSTSAAPSPAKNSGGEYAASKVVVNRSMSLDGFIAGPGHAVDWIFDFVAPDEFPDIAAATGAMLIGRRTHEVGKRGIETARRGKISGEDYGGDGPDPSSSSPIGRLTRRTPVTFLTGDSGP